MSKLAAIAAIAAAAVWPWHSLAGQDPRVIEAVYDPTSVYAITISPELASVIESQNDESIESLVVGDPTSWTIEVTANSDRVVVKPQPGAATTNLIVMTTRRTYAFTLEAVAGNGIFVFRFGDRHSAITDSYRIRGDRSLRPARIFDNGRTTTVTWNRAQELPAVFARDHDGDEIAVTWRAVSGGLVINGVHDRLVFRRGKSKATAERETEPRL